jgi:hypothetical protein
MKIVKVIFDFIRISIVRLIDFGTNIVDCMETNPLFSKPDVPITDLKASLDVLKEKHSNALKGSIEAKEGVAIARKAFIKLLKLEALYVDRIANGNQEIMASSGFHTSKQPEPATRPEFRVLNAYTEGNIVLIRKAVKGAAAYIWQYVPNPLPEDEKLWVYAGVSPQAKCVIENLDVGTKYWFRVAAVTRKGQLEWSKPIMKLVV